MHKRFASWAPGAFFLVLTLSSGLWADVPSTINFQGMLKDGSGDPVSDSSYSVTFRIFDAPTGGTAFWFENQTVSTSAGLFNAVLGALTAIPDTVFNDTVRYLGITVIPDAEMNPREQLRTVPYAFRVASVNGATGGVISGDVLIQSDLEVDGAFIRTIARAHGYSNDATDNGALATRTLTFNKVHANTGIRVTYTDNMRVLGNGAGRWEIRVNGQPCPNPGALVYDYYEDGVNSNYMHQSQTVCGTCFDLPAGSTTVQIYVSPSPGYGPMDLYTGWNNSYWSIEAEEVR